jgi:hypothetical protein
MAFPRFLKCNNTTILNGRLKTHPEWKTMGGIPSAVSGTCIYNITLGENGYMNFWNYCHYWFNC